MRKHHEIKGYILIADYPGNRRRVGDFEPYSTGEFSRYPHLWKVVYHQDVIRDIKLTELGI